MTRANALGFGALRWSVTQVLVAPALGWGDFGLWHAPLVSLYTLLPHLAWAVTAGWLLHEEELGHVPLRHQLARLHLVHAHPRGLTSARDTRRR